MAIDGGLRDSLAVGTRLVARYKHEAHTADVVAGEDGKTRYRLADGREFKSPSAAGSAVMGGQACNGWRWWSVEGSAGALKMKPAAATGAPTRATKPKVAKVLAGAKEPAPTKASTGFCQNSGLDPDFTLLRAEKPHALESDGPPLEGPLGGQMHPEP